MLSFANSWRRLLEEGYMAAAGLFSVLTIRAGTSTKGLRWKQAMPRHTMKCVDISTRSAMPGKYREGGSGYVGEVYR